LSPFTEFAKGDGVISLAPDDHRLVGAGDTGHVRDIDDGLIHGHTTEDGTAFTMDENETAVAAGAGQAVGISGTKNRDF